MEKTKVAFISQPWETALPPQSAIMIWTQEVARRLVPSCAVTVYARRRKKRQHRVMHDHGVEYVLTSHEPERWLVGILNRLETLFPRQRPPFSSPIYYLAYYLGIARTMQKRGYDIAHIFNFSQAVPIIRAFNPHIKIVLHMRCDWLVQLDQAMIEKRLSKADLVLGTTDYITRGIRRKYPQFAERCHTVFNAVDTSRFVGRTNGQTPPEPRQARKLLFVGRISPEKGIHVLLDAFAQVRQHCPDVQLELVGHVGSANRTYIALLREGNNIDDLAPFYDGQGYKAHLDKRISPQDREHVTFAGFVQNHELLKHYRSADIFLFPSVVHEAFGVPIVEAMAVEVPVIASRQGGITELVEHGKTGLLVKPNDAPALAEAILYLLQNEEIRHAMAQAGRQRAIDMFSWERTTAAVRQHYQQLMQ